MRSVLFLVVSLLVIGCADVRLPYEDWPASVHEFISLSDADLTALTNMADTLNADLGKPVIRIGGSVLQGYPITIEKVNSLPNPSHVGFAKRYTDHCEIQLRADMFSRDNLLQSVFWHELGHCGGLKHSGEAHQVMSPDASPFSSFSANALSTFFAALTASTGLLAP
ncbi:MAG: hypothetical protein H6617_02105 [Bdellovibrionaceae bacterium]|nr:hypothetical protein [Bdellovibrionales bacterium]MCB9253458.1 hypothetical protein [Pseudobdellovibrionaceae bacterium]